jgi:hypothetical protein
MTTTSSVRRFDIHTFTDFRTFGLSANATAADMRWVDIKTEDIVDFKVVSLERKHASATLTVHSADREHPEEYAFAKSGMDYLAYRLGIHYKDFGTITDLKASLAARKITHMVLCIFRGMVLGTPTKYEGIMGHDKVISRIEPFSSHFQWGKVTPDEMIAIFSKVSPDVSARKLRFGVRVRNGMTGTAALSVSYALIADRRVFEYSRHSRSRHTTFEAVLATIDTIEEMLVADEMYDLLAKLEASASESPLSLVTMVIELPADLEKAEKWFSDETSLSLADIIAIAIEKDFSNVLINKLIETFTA